MASRARAADQTSPGIFAAPQAPLPAGALPAGALPASTLPRRHPARRRPARPIPGVASPGASRAAHRPPASHRRESGAAGPGEPGPRPARRPRPGRPPDPRWYRRPRWLAALAAAAVLVAGLGASAGLATGRPAGQGHGHHAADVARAQTHAERADERADRDQQKRGGHGPAPALDLHAGQIPGHGDLHRAGDRHHHGGVPASRASRPCTRRTPPRSRRNSGHFRQDFSDCGAQLTYGEVGWNHNFQPPRRPPWIR